MPTDARLQLELVGHLGRLTAWSFGSLFFGAMVLLRHLRSRVPAATLGAGAMTLGWAAADLAIILISARSGPPKDPEAFRRFLGLNLMLNLVWIGIGLAMARNRTNPWTKGAGLSMIVQGAALQALDGLLYVRISL